MTRIVSFLFFFIINFSLIAQYSLSGKITHQNEPIPFVNLLIENTNKGTVGSFDGNFMLKNLQPGNYNLLISAVGYEKTSKSFVISNKNMELGTMELESSNYEIGEVVITGNLKETYIDDSPVKIEVLTPKFFKTNPTNNVIEALQTVNGVQEQINCGVCATNDIHINGMEGPYTLLLIDGMPIMSALASVYGFNGIPTSLIRQVEIVKGPSSTLYGTEAVGGVINIITKGEEDIPLFGLSTFYTSHHESNTDLSFKFKLNKKVSSVFSTNFYRNQYRMDFNDDNFTDIPLNNRVSIFNKWTIHSKRSKPSTIGIRYYNEDRFGGVMDWQKEHRGDTLVYGESIYTKRIEVISSVPIPLKNHNWKLDMSFNRHDQNSFYGNTSYNALQHVGFANFLMNETWRRHNFTMGITNRYQTYEDNSMAQVNESQYIPGVFIQDEMVLGSKSDLLYGLRVDHHSNHGVILSPRINVKHKLGDFTTARMNLGTGFRQVHLFTEDHAALTGSREVVIKNELNPEESYNATFNIRHTYSVKPGIGTLDMDLFYTYFTNKIIPNYDIDPDFIIYDNLPGYGITRGGSVSVEHKFKIPLSVKTGCTIQDVYNVSTDDDTGELVKEAQEFAPLVSGTFIVGYEIKKWQASINYTGRVVGPQHLPQFHPQFEKPEFSEWYSIQNLQITKTFNKAFEAFGGVKNLLNYTQSSPLIDPQNPFGDYFDTSFAYGPLQVRRYYIGFRYNVFGKAIAK